MTAKKKSAIVSIELKLTCGACKFWLPEKAKLERDYGWCKRYPKSFNGAEFSHPAEHRSEAACGEFKPLMEG